MSPASNECPTCGQPIADTGVICHTCAGLLERDLRQIATDWMQLQITVTRQDRIGDPAASGAETPVMFNVHASQVAGDTAATLRAWAVYVAGQRGQTIPHMPRRPHPREHAQYLAHQVDWLRHREHVDQAVDAVRKHARDIRHCIDRPAPRVFCGTCVTCGDYLYANPNAATTTCRKGCDGVYDVAEQRDWLLKHAEDQIAHGRLIARALASFGETVNYNTIKTWAARGRIVPRGTDNAGRPLYAVRDILEIVRSDAYKPRKKGSVA